jgi:hypothetical protein
MTSSRCAAPRPFPHLGRTTSKCFASCLPSDAFTEVIMTHPTVFEYLSNLSSDSSDALHVNPEFLDHLSLF